MNRVVLVGRLTKDPDLRFTPNGGKPVSNFTLAVDRRFKSQGQPDADFVPIVVWGKQAESVANYLVKGSQASISGRIQTRNYEAKDGTRRYITEVVADEVQFLNSKAHSADNNTSNNNTNNNANDANDANDANGVNQYDDDITPIDDSDIPF